MKFCQSLRPTRIQTSCYTAKAAGALLGRDPQKNNQSQNKKNKRTPAKFDTSKPWKQSDGPCPLQARGSGCDGRHWKKDCDNPNKVDTRPPPKGDSNPLDGKSNLSQSASDADAAKALFGGGSNEVALAALS